MNRRDFSAQLAALTPSFDVMLTNFNGPLPAPCDEHCRAIYATYRMLTEADRCAALEQLTFEQRSWFSSWPDRLAMLAVRLGSQGYLDDSIMGRYAAYSGSDSEPVDMQAYWGGLAVSLRVARLMSFGTEVLKAQLPYACHPDVPESVRIFLAKPLEEQQLSRWDYREELGDHGIIFRWGALPVPEAWL